LIAHETVHAFVGSLHAQEGEDDWYSEGIADYLCMVLPLEAGLYTPAEFGKLINEEAHFTTPMRFVRFQKKIFLV
jgi:predicted metalloprotease with PDZ domain